MATLKEFLKADRFATCAGVELLEIKPGYARACMEVTDPASEWWRSMSRRRLVYIGRSGFCSCSEQP